jgi:hypothetical protein
MRGSDRRRAGIVRVSDHALLRFIERAGGLDVETLRTALEVSLKRAVNAADTIGQKELVIVADGLRYVLRDNVVVSITGSTTARDGKRA